MEFTNENEIWLIGTVSSSFPEGLPTVRDVFRVYFYHRLVLLKQKTPSVNSVAKDIIAHCHGPGTSTLAVQDVVRKIQRAIDKHDAFKKSMHRQSHTQRRNEQEFIDFLCDRFDIFSKQNYHHNKKNKLETELNQCEVVPIPEIAKSVITDIEMCDSDDNSNEVNNNTDEKDADFELNLSKYQKSKLSVGSNKKSVGVIHKIINSPNVTSLLDRTGISSPKFTMLCATIAGVIGEDLNEVTLSSSTIDRRRKVHRDLIVTTIKDDFMSSARPQLVLHWDRKKLLDTTNEISTLRKKKVERLAIVVTGIDTQKIVTIAKTEDGTGLVTSDTVYEHVIGWNLSEAIVAICTDTTASNTGIWNGSVVLFQQLIQRNILYFACRHHVDELIIGGVYIGLFGETTGPSPEMFENFKRDWHSIDQTSFKPLDQKIFKGNAYIRSLKEEIIHYVENILDNQKCNLKGDYSEMLELCLILLGQPIPNYTFHNPHACSHARWMAKIIYSMKIYLFLQNLELNKAEIKKLENICLFICLVYVKHWTQVCSSSNAPFNDLMLMKELERYSTVNPEISRLAIFKFKEHLWYLGSELVVLSLFSDKVADSVKNRMFRKMKKLDRNEWTERNLRLLVCSDFSKKDLHDFVDGSSMAALKSLKLDIDFMIENNASNWKNLGRYKTAKKVVDSFHVVNDCAERALKLMTDFNESLTTKEPEKQRAIQVIEDNRKRIPNAKKSVLLSYTKQSFK